MAITVGFIIFFLRDLISQLVPRISKLRHKDTEIEFAETMELLKERAEDSILLDSELIDEFKDERQRLDALSAIVPRSALIQAWGIIDREVCDYLLKTRVKTDKKSLKTSGVIEKIKGLELNSDDLKIFLELRKIMKSVTDPKEFELSSDQVQSHIELAIGLVKKIREASSKKTLQRTSV